MIKQEELKATLKRKNSWNIGECVLVGFQEKVLLLK